MTPSRGFTDLIRQVAMDVRQTEPALAQVVALLARERPHYNWVGIYLLEGDKLLLPSLKNNRIKMQILLDGLNSPSANISPKFLASSFKRA
jgi:putative methionine-R-sulfoxide reductase with GAF domain